MWPAGPTDLFLSLIILSFGFVFKTHISVEISSCAERWPGESGSPSFDFFFFSLLFSFATQNLLNWFELAMLRFWAAKAALWSEMMTSEVQSGASAQQQDNTGGAQLNQPGWSHRTPAISLICCSCAEPAATFSACGGCRASATFALFTAPRLSELQSQQPAALMWAPGKEVSYLPLGSFEKLWNNSITPSKIPPTAEKKKKKKNSSWTENRRWLLFTQTASAQLWPWQFSFTIAAMHLISMGRAKLASRERVIRVPPLHAITCRWKCWSSHKKPRQRVEERVTSADGGVCCELAAAKQKTC